MNNKIGKVISMLGERRSDIMLLILTLLLGAMLGSVVNVKEYNLEGVFHEGVEDANYTEVVAFMEKDQTDKNLYKEGIYNCRDFTLDTMDNAAEQGIRSAYVIVQGNLVAHAIIAFRCSDLEKIVFFEPQSDEIVFPTEEDILAFYWCDESD